MTPDLPHFIANAIQHRLSQIRLHGADVSRLEGVQTTKDVKHGFLNEVAGIEGIAGGGRQLAVRPAFQLRHASLQECLDGLTVSASRANDKLHRWLVAEQVRLALVVSRRQ